MEFRCSEPHTRGGTHNLRDAAAAWQGAPAFRAGDPTFDAYHVAAELESERAHTALEDWRSGRSRVLGIEDRPDTGPQVHDATTPFRRRGRTGRFVLTSGYARSEMEGLLAEVEDASFLPEPWTLAELKTLLDGTGADAASPGTASERPTTPGSIPPR